MRASQSISSGFSSARRYWWIALIFFAASFLMAATVAAPMRGAIAAHLGNSAMSEGVARGLDSNWLTEFQIAYAPFLEGFTTAVMWSVLLFVVLNAVLSAGAFEVFAQARAAGVVRDVRAGMRDFGHGIGRHGMRFLRLALIASLLYFLVFLVWEYWASKLLEKTFRYSITEAPYFWSDFARQLILLTHIAIVNIVVQFTKADIVLHEHRTTLGALGHAFGFVLRRLPRVLAIAATFGLVTVAAVAAYMVFARYFPQDSWVTVIVWLLVAQALLFVRWWARIAFWGAAVAYTPVSVPVVEPAQV